MNEQIYLLQIAKGLQELNILLGKKFDSIVKELSEIKKELSNRKS